MAVTGAAQSLIDIAKEQDYAFLPQALQKYILERSKKDCQTLNLSVKDYWTVADNKSKHEMLEKFYRDNIQTPTQSAYSGINFSKLCKVTGWRNNCALNCLTHFLATKIKEGEVQKLFANDPTYQTFLKSFQEYYSLTKVPSWNDIQFLFKSLPIPIDREAFFAPVLRLLLGNMLKNRKDEIWNTHSWEIVDFITSSISEKDKDMPTNPILRANLKPLLELRTWYRKELEDSVKNIPSATERENAKLQILAEQFIDDPNEKQIFEQVKIFRKEDLFKELQVSANALWIAQGSDNYADFMGNINHSQEISADYFQILANALHIGLAIYAPQRSIIIQPPTNFHWYLKIYNQGYHWEFEEPTSILFEARKNTTLHNRCYTLDNMPCYPGKFAIRAIDNEGSIQATISTAIKKLLDEKTSSEQLLQARYETLPSELKEFFELQTAKKRTSAQFSKADYWFIADIKEKREILEAFSQCKEKPKSSPARIPASTPKSPYLKNKFNDLPKELQQFISTNMKKESEKAKLTLQEFWFTTDDKQKNEILEIYSATHVRISIQNKK